MKTFRELLNEAVGSVTINMSYSVNVDTRKKIEITKSVSKLKIKKDTERWFDGILTQYLMAVDYEEHMTWTKEELLSDSAVRFTLSWASGGVSAGFEDVSINGGLWDKKTAKLSKQHISSEMILDRLEPILKATEKDFKMFNLKFSKPKITIAK